MRSFFRGRAVFCLLFVSPSSALSMTVLPFSSAGPAGRLRGISGRAAGAPEAEKSNDFIPFPAYFKKNALLP